VNQKQIDILKDIFSAVLDLPLSYDVTKVRMISESRWDSLATVSFMSAIESELGVQLDHDDLELMTSFRAVKVLLEQKGL
jgi:acyl carrier protein